MASTLPRAQRTTSVKVTRPAPYRGLNTVDALAEMDPTYALQLTNFIATPQGCAPRQGYRKWSTGFTSSVTTILPYNAKIASNNKLFAIAGTNVYDITTGGVIGTPVVTGLNTNNVYWQSARQSYTTSTNNYMIMVNGVDFPRLYDSSTWTTCSQTASPAAPGQFSNVDNNGNAVNITTFVDTVLHYQRLWFVANNSSKAYYLPIAQVGGQLSSFDFGPLFTRGGSLYKLDTWTMDIGSTQGTQALLVAISNKGDVVVFAGNDPSDATKWTLVGSYQLGSPVGRRCTTQYQGDLMILTQDGLYPLSRYLQSARLDSTAALTYTIGPTIANLTTSYSSMPGFELCVYPSENVMMLNIPQANVTSNFQFCFHTITKGWSQFSGWPAQCFGAFNDALYFGSTDSVALAFIGYADGANIDGTGGNNIVASALGAFDDMSKSGQFAPGTIKQVSLVRPFINSGTLNPKVSIGVNTDFNLATLTGTATLNPVSSAVWNASVWNGAGATWAGSSLSTYNQWSTPACYPGEFLSLAITISVTADTLWANTSYIIQPGGQFA